MAAYNDSHDVSLLIGSPIAALVRAQDQATRLSLELIRELGFEGNQLRMTNFAASADTMAGSASPIGATGLQIPTLLLANIPHLRVAEATFDLSAKLVGMASRPSQHEAWDAPNPCMQAKIVHGGSTGGRDRNARRYSMRFTVRVVSDEWPVNLDRLAVEC